MIAAAMRHWTFRCRWILLGAALAATTGCRRSGQSAPADHPRVNPGVMLYDITFRSAALGRDIQYRVISPSHFVRPKLPVVYLLHGGGGGFRDWSNYSDVAGFAESGRLLVMPEGESSYYTNAVDPPQDRFEDYLTRDLIDDVEDRFPAASGRANRAIIGVHGRFRRGEDSVAPSRSLRFCRRNQFRNRCSTPCVLLEAT